MFLCSLLVVLTACKPVEEPSNKNKPMPINPKCIASQSQCEIGNDFLKFSVKFSQQQLGDKIKTELPVYIELTELSKESSEETVSLNDEKLTNNQSAIPNSSPSDSTIKLSAYLEGRDMFMGKVPVFFDKKQEQNLYLAESLLASCTEEEMVWRLWITAEKEGETQTLFIDFTSKRL